MRCRKNCLAPSKRLEGIPRLTLAQSGACKKPEIARLFAPPAKPLTPEPFDVEFVARQITKVCFALGVCCLCSIVAARVRHGDILRGHGIMDSVRGSFLLFASHAHFIFQYRFVSIQAHLRKKQRSLRRICQALSHGIVEVEAHIHDLASHANLACQSRQGVQELMDELEHT